jgi:hypothetical protein
MYVFKMPYKVSKFNILLKKGLAGFKPFAFGLQKNLIFLCLRQCEAARNGTG